MSTFLCVKYDSHFGDYADTSVDEVYFVALHHLNIETEACSCIA